MPRFWIEAEGSAFGACGQRSCFFRGLGRSGLWTGQRPEPQPPAQPTSQPTSQPALATLLLSQPKRSSSSSTNRAAIQLMALRLGEPSRKQPDAQAFSQAAGQQAPPALGLTALLHFATSRSRKPQAFSQAFGQALAQAAGSGQQPLASFAQVFGSSQTAALGFEHVLDARRTGHAPEWQ